MEAKRIRPPSQRHVDAFTLVAVQGKSREEVAASLKVKPVTVTRILRRMQLWMQTALQPWETVDERYQRAVLARNLYVARLEHQWNELMQAWYRSTKPLQTDKSVYDKNDKVSKTELGHRGQCGNVRYLSEARRVLDKLLAIEPRDANAKEPRNDSSVIERRAEIDRILAEYRQRGTTPADDSGDSGPAASVGDDCAA